MLKLHDYQKKARDFIIGRLEHESGAGLWLDPGLGKTIVALEVIALMKWLYGTKRTLILAPRRVVYNVWPKEIAKWNLDLRAVIVHGQSAKKTKELLASDHDVFIMTKDSTVSLAQQKARFDFVVVDESTAYKNWSSRRSLGLRHVLMRIPKRMVMTGTPTPNTLPDIFMQQYILDSGRTLGTKIGNFRTQFEMYQHGEYYKWEFPKHKERELLDRVGEWYIAQSALDHLDMPELIENVVEIELPDEAKKFYKDMQKEMYAQLDSGDRLIALTGGSRYSLCRQIASGTVYGEDKKVLEVHTAKLDALEDLIDELNGKPLLIAYCWNHEIAGLRKRWPRMQFVNGATTDSEFTRIVGEFKAGRLPLLAAQCQGMSHGVDGLQENCSDLCWLSLTDQPEVHEQFNKRVYRQGVKGKCVRIHKLIAKGTVDVPINAALTQKATKQSEVLKFVKEMRA